MGNKYSTSKPKFYHLFLNTKLKIKREIAVRTIVGPDGNLKYEAIRIPVAVARVPKTIERI